MSKEDTWFQKGHVGGPGRPRGSKNKLSENFIADLNAGWNKYGRQVIDNVAQDQPAKFLAIVAGLLPKDVLLTVVDNRPMIELTAEELLAIAGPNNKAA